MGLVSCRITHKEYKMDLDLASIIVRLLIFISWRVIKTWNDQIILKEIVSDYETWRKDHY